ncbi:MAG TPA: TMEM175 family protein [Allosphingosinicella sp.]|nr:TMEM175 family protein [Allosphingosinicella sp.]
MSNSAGRLDNFTDAAFAFAVSLLVIGGAGAPSDFNALVRALGDIPAFAFGFAVVVLFWYAHVRWRRLRGEGDWRSLCLTLLLVFLVLIYIQPLRAMAAATAIFFTGQGGGYRGNVANLFAVYGTGFVLMSATIAALFADSLRKAGLGRAERAQAKGEIAIWLILVTTGAVSILLSLTRFGPFAAFAYSTLPVSIGLFSRRYDWTGGEEEQA